MLEGYAQRHFDAVSAAGRFLLDVLPIRNPHSGIALDAFVRRIKESELHSVDIEAIAIRCLSVLQARFNAGIPSLVDRFVQAQARVPDPLIRDQNLYASSQASQGHLNVSSAQSLKYVRAN